jgi:hypothetical protein
MILLPAQKLQLRNLYLLDADDFPVSLIAVSKNQQPKTSIEQIHMKKLLITISISGLLALSSVGIAQEAPEPADGSNRLEARLNPVIAVDASGQARLDFGPGTANDRFTAEVEIAKDDFGPLGITLATASEMRSWSCASCAAACWSSATVCNSL